MDNEKFLALSDIMCKVKTYMDEFGEDVTVGICRYSGKAHITVSIGSESIEFTFKEGGDE